jgi:lysozyme
VKVTLNNNQFGALVSFVFNVGVAAFASSTLLRLLNKGDYLSVPGQLSRWNKITVNKKKIPSDGLTHRRSAEIALWSTGAVFTSPSNIATIEHRPLLKSKTLQGLSLTSAGAVGSQLTEAATQIQMVADYSETLKTVFIITMLAGIALATYGRLRLRNEEHV